MIQVNNGERLPATFGRISGIAGVMVTDAGMKVAMHGAYRDFRGVRRGTVDGNPVEVLAIERSNPAFGGIEGMIVLTVAAVIPDQQ